MPVSSGLAEELRVQLVPESLCRGTGLEGVCGVWALIKSQVSMASVHLSFSITCPSPLVHLLVPGRWDSKMEMPPTSHSPALGLRPHLFS